ncbi:hypothetical protein EJ07DRAFT_174273 [Lizonia empirigonia]|nr:hypothetical protein EJ07DRAFT_174273 [Lizonia empirigonia]
MANKVETLHSIREWAKATFPDSFAKFYNLPIPKTSHRQNKSRVSYDGYWIRDMGSPLMIEVGTLEDQGGRPVYAWGADRSVRLGHKADVEGYMELHSDTCSPKIVFAKPFCWVKPAEDETGKARFDALVRYYLCIKHDRPISYRVAAFKIDFRGACEDISEQLTRETSEHGTADRCVRPKLSHEVHLTTDPAPATSSISTPTPPIPASATASASPVQSVDNPEHGAESTTSVTTPNTHLQALDQAFALFRTSLNVQVTAAEAAANHDKAELTSQIHSLERRIADAGVERERLEASLEEARGESEKWKVQYEKLKTSVLATVERG